MKINKEVKTGIIALLIIALFIWGFNFLKDKNLYDNSRTFYAEYTNVQGLVIDAPVTISGLKVGKVSKITFSNNKKGILIVHFNLSNKIKFSKNSIAQIYSPDFISGKSLKISIANDSDEFAIDGDTLIGEIDSGILGMINEQIAPLQSKVESFVVNTDSVMQNLNQVLSDENQKNLKMALHSLRLTLEKFNSVADRADILLKSNDSKFDSILNNANTAMQNFSQISDSLQKANLGGTITKLEYTLDSFNNLLDSIESGRGTIGKLMKDEGLYNNLEKATKELEELLRDVKLHPKRYVHVSVFGKKDKGYQEGNPDE